MNDFKLFKNEKTVLDTLSDKGFCAYIVGGAVRDRLCGIIPLDSDITTNALPSQTKEAFSDRKVIETGIKHGTVTVLIDSTPMEITTFRTDGSYTDNRHPDQVEYTCVLADDLSRRDFTINAMAYNEQDGIVDLFGGRQDLQNKIIRCVGEPDRRFKEDALRILRAARFASTLGFDIEPQTLQAMRDNIDLLDNISAERKFTELKKLLCGKSAGKVITKYSFVITKIIPELSVEIGFLQHNPHHIYTVYNHTALVVNNIENKPHLRLAALLHDIGKPHCFTLDQKGVGHFKGHAKLGADIAHKVLRTLKSDNFTLKRVCLLIERHSDKIENTAPCVLEMLKNIGEQAFFELLDLRDADNSAKAAPEKAKGLAASHELRKTARALIDGGACTSLDKLNIKGDRLIELGIKKGSAVGEALNILLSKVISGELKNTSDALEAYAEKMVQDNGKM